MKTQLSESETARQNQTNSDSYSACSKQQTQGSSLWKDYIKPPLRQLRWAITGEPRQEIVKPLTWSNSWYWLYRTIKPDLLHYYPKPRPLSIRRLWALLKPNLKQPIFIFGSPRSGTTFLGDCLAVLPEFSYHFEPVATKAAVRYVYTGQWKTAKAKWFYQTVYSWLLRIHLDGDLHFVEKTPRNGFILPFLYSTFPDAKFINIIRDGRDVSVSLSKKPWYRNDKRGTTQREPGGYLCGPWARFWVEPGRVRQFETTSDSHRCIWLWRRYVEAALEGAAQIPAHQYYQLKYEALVAEPHNEATRLLDFLAIKSPESRYLFQNTVADKVKSDSVGRWQIELSEAQLEQIAQEAGELLKKLDYVR